jgi:hypothetical protein
MGRLGHPVQQHPVDRPPDGAEGRSVAGADGQLGPVLAERADLDVGLQPGQQSLQPKRLPGQGQRRHGGEADRLAELDRDPPAEPVAQRPNSDLGEQPVAAPLGFPGQRRHPLRRRVEQRLFHPLMRERELQVVANKHDGQGGRPGG